MGHDLLVAPVIERGARSRDVYLPAGERWVDLWSGRTHAGGATIRVEAPIGTLPLFLRDGGSRVLFGSYVDTLVRRSKVTDPSVRTFDDAERSLALLTPSFVATARSYDGTALELVARSPAVVLEPTTPSELEMLPTALTRTWTRLACGRGQSGGLAFDSAMLRGKWIEVTAAMPRTITVYAVGAT